MIPDSCSNGSRCLEDGIFFSVRCISNVLRSILVRYVNRSVLDAAKSTSELMKIDVTSKDVRCTYKDADVGVGAQKELIKCKLGDLEKIKFRMQCIDFHAATAAKVIERSPLTYTIVRAISCFVPSRIASNRTLSEWQNWHRSCLSVTTLRQSFATVQKYSFLIYAVKQLAI